MIERLQKENEALKKRIRDLEDAPCLSEGWHVFAGGEFLGVFSCYEVAHRNAVELAEPGETTYVLRVEDKIEPENRDWGKFYGVRRGYDYPATL